MELTDALIDQYNKIHSPLARSRWLPGFSDLSRAYVRCVKRGSGETHVRSQSLSNYPRRAKRAHMGGQYFIVFQFYSFIDLSV